MATTQDYAVLSLYVYDVRNRLDNRPELRMGWCWSELELHTENLFAFTFGVFRSLSTDENVVSYTGTNEGLDWLSNFGNGAGLGSPQAIAQSADGADAQAWSNMGMEMGRFAMPGSAVGLRGVAGHELRSFKGLQEGISPLGSL